MLIDWFTVVAQFFNFLILVWLMKRFLYKPVLAAIEARESRIAVEFQNADVKKLEAEKEKSDFDHKIAEFEAQRGALMTRALQDAELESTKLKDAATKENLTQRVAQQEALSIEALSLKQALRRQVQDEVFAIARKTLSDLASANLEVQMTEVFIAHLRLLNEASKTKFTKETSGSSQIPVICSAFDLPDEQRAMIQTACNETFSATVPLHFEIAPRLISGIEFTWNGQRVSWSIDNYLSAVEEAVGKLAAAKPQNKSKGDVAA